MTLFAYTVNTVAFFFMVCKFHGRSNPIKLDCQQPEFSRKIQNHGTLVTPFSCTTLSQYCQGD